MNLRLFESGAPRVKICGITNRADALDAIEAGADALGFNFVGASRRGLDPAGAIGWIAGLPHRASRVAVVADPPAALLDRLVGSGAFDVIQFHGGEGPEFCAGVRRCAWIKAMRAVDADATARRAAAYETGCVLLDSAGAGGFGGSGEVADWAEAAAIRAALADRLVLLAGGLTPENVASAIRAVRPHGVDVSSGVEADHDPRRKDPRKLRAFIAAVRGASRLDPARSSRVDR